MSHALCVVNHPIFVILSGVSLPQARRTESKDPYTRRYRLLLRSCQVLMTYKHVHSTPLFIPKP